MSQITVKDGAGADQTVAAVDDTGTAAAADSLPVTLSTEDKAALADIATQATLAALNAKVPALGQALAAASVPVVLPAAQITTLTPPAAITGFATETTLAALNAKAPALGQALAAASVPVILPAATITTLTPPAAITGFATETTLAAANTAIGASADAAVTAGATGSLSAKLRSISRDIAALIAPATAPATGTQTSVASGTGDVTILASNAARKGACIFNDDANALLLLLASGTSSATNYSVSIPGGGYYELPLCQGGVYTGVLKGLWEADGSGSARVTEFT